MGVEQVPPGLNITTFTNKASATPSADLGLVKGYYKSVQLAQLLKDRVPLFSKIVLH